MTADPIGSTQMVSQQTEGDARGALAGLSIYRRVLMEARAYWWHIGGLLVLSLLSTPLSLLAPVPLAIAVDSVIGDRPLPGFLDAVLPDSLTRTPDAILVTAVALVVLTALLQRVRSLVKGVLKIYTGERILLTVRARLLAQAQRLSFMYHDSTGTMDATYRIHTDASAVKSLATSGFIPFISAGTQLAAMIAVTVRIDAQLAMVALLITPALFLALCLNVRRLHGGWHGVKRLDSAIMSTTQEILTGIRVVTAFGQEERERERLVHRGAEHVRARTRLAVVENWLALLIGLIVAVGTASVLWVGVGHVRDGSLSVGGLLLVMSYLSQLYRPLETIAERIGMVQSSLVGAERALRLLDLPPGVPERPDARPLRRARGAVVLDRVSFAYGDGSPVLHDVSLSVDPGMRLGIVGATGAGKTTLVTLLSRFFDPTSGRILLDGVDLRDYRLADLRDQFTIVLQEPLLFSTSVGENIAYARPGATFEEIRTAARQAHADDFITHLPDGYETTVGERGMRLSGGERQRIAMARAFLKDAPILVLDEPTSAVDARTEAAIQETTASLMRGRTTLLITHRQTMLRGCDQVVEIDGGRVVSRPSSGRAGAR